MVTRIQRRSRKQEQRGAARINGRTTPSSGSGWAVKNDVKNDKVSIEFKFTDKKSYSLKHEDLIKAEKNALIDGGREFAYVIEIGGREWAVTSREFFEELLSRGDS